MACALRRHGVTDSGNCLRHKEVKVPYTHGVQYISERFDEISGLARFIGQPPRNQYTSP
ncbi:MAG: hypothetical protein P8X74_16050 [Reinekea sp.]